MVNTNNGLADIKDAICDRLETYTYFAIGTGTTPASADDTALQNEVFRKTVTEIQRTTSGVLFRCYVSTTEANGHNISEFGLFNADSGGTMLCRRVFSAIPKTNDMDIWFELEEVITIT